MHLTKKSHSICGNSVQTADTWYWHFLCFLFPKLDSLPLKTLKLVQIYLKINSFLHIKHWVIIRKTNQIIRLRTLMVIYSKNPTTYKVRVHRAEYFILARVLKNHWRGLNAKFIIMNFENWMFSPEITVQPYKKFRCHLVGL